MQDSTAAVVVFTHCDYIRITLILYNDIIISEAQNYFCEEIFSKRIPYMHKFSWYVNFTNSVVASNTAKI